MNQFYEMKGIMRRYTVAKTPQQNRVAERGDKTIIEAARTMLADFKLPTTFWAEAVNTACYVKNRVTRIVEENLHIRFSESTPNVVGTQSNGFAGTKASDKADPNSSHDDGSKPSSDDGKKVDEDPSKESECNDQEKEDNVNSTNNVNIIGNVNTVSSIVNADGTNEVNAIGGKISIELPFDPNMHALEDVSIFNFSSDDEDDGAVVDMNNLDTTIQVSPTSTIIIHKDHPLDQVIRGRTQKGNSCIERSKLDRGYAGRAFIIQVIKNWTLVDLPNRKRAIGSKWFFRNKKDEKEIVISNKARLVAQGYTQEEEIDYDEVFAPVARIRAIRLFLVDASFKDFMVYQIDVKSAFIYGKIEEEVYVCQPPGFKDPDFPDRVYKVEIALYELHQAPRAWYETLSTYLLDNDFQKRKIDKTLFIKRHKDEFYGRTYIHLGIASESEEGLHICLWYPNDSPFDLVAYTDSDYAEESLDRKSTTGGCQFLRYRLISRQWKKQTVVANFTIEAEYVVASSCCGQVLWIQNQLLDYGPPISDKEMELWVELKRLYEPDDEDQLLTHTQNMMHAPVEWKLEGLPSEEGSGDYDDQLQASSRELLSDGK
nr:hypothetical protein [Tanacetum cinerariifolium]